MPDALQQGFPNYGLQNGRDSSRFCLDLAEVHSKVTTKNLPLLIDRSALRRSVET